MSITVVPDTKNKYAGKVVSFQKIEPGTEVSPDMEIVDIVRTTSVVEWREESLHPKAGQRKDDGYGTHPDTISVTKREPHEIAVAIVAKTTNAIALELANTREELNVTMSNLDNTHRLLNTTREEKTALQKVLDENAAKLTLWMERRDAEWRAHEESKRLVRELQAQLALIEKRVGSVMFSDLTSPEKR